MMRVKVCGITTPEDAVLAADLGAFAIGLVFWPLSPRVVARDVARRVVQALPAGVESVGVFVDQSPADVRAIADEVGLTAVQLHGGERVTEYEQSARLVVKAVAMRGGDDVRTAVELPAPVLALLDAHDPVRRGATGRTITVPVNGDTGDRIDETFVETLSAAAAQYEVPAAAA